MQGADSCIKGRRVDIERLLQTKYEIIIDTHYGLQSKHGVMAYMLTQGKRLFIDFQLLDDIRQEHRYRFTLAEELAHYVIHHKVYKDCSTIDERIEIESLFTGQELYFLETNAKALASAILMPKIIFEGRVNELFSAIGNNPSHTSPIVTILSRDFDVSNQAVKRRLKNLGYHKRSDLKLME